MNAHNITMQVISHGPTQPPLSPADCHAANIQLNTAILASGETRARFAGFATLPMGDPDEAAKELAFCIEELGFVGALIDNHAEGRTYEGVEYRTFWHMVQSLGVPIYLHPSWATDVMRQGVFPGFDASNNNDNNTSTSTSPLSKSAVDSLMASSWNWHSDVALHTFKLFASGLFDRFPRLKIILGHFGEMIPYMLDRTIQLSPRWNASSPLKRPFKQVYDENIWVTTSGVWSLDPLRCMLGNTKRDRILFSVDYPFARNEWGEKWMGELIASGLCSREEVEGIAFRNAERLLGIRVRREGESVQGEEDGEGSREDGDEGTQKEGV